MREANLQTELNSLRTERDDLADKLWATIEEQRVWIDKATEVDSRVALAEEILVRERIEA